MLKTNMSDFEMFIHHSELIGFGCIEAQLVLDNQNQQLIDVYFNIDHDLIFNCEAFVENILKSSNCFLEIKNISILGLAGLFWTQFTIKTYLGTKIVFCDPTPKKNLIT